MLHISSQSSPQSVSPILPEAEPAPLFGEISFAQFLDFAISVEASDLHFSEGERVALRVFGAIRFLNEVPPLSAKKMEEFLFGMIQNDLHRTRFLENKELDFAYEFRDGINFRVNAFFKRGKMAVVMRRIASKANTLEDLGTPAAVKTLLTKKQGLILVTGPTGSGKSTTMQAMLEEVNKTRVEHILTIEDPIEFLFVSKKSIFSQREVGRDTDSFANALRAAMREDPDIVMVGEMRDPETIMAALNLSETGHLVISTLHTSSAAHTIARTVGAFPPEQHFQIQSRLADALIGVVSQRLIPRTDRSGRIAIFELLIANGAVRNLIRNGEISQIYNAMLAGKSEGMVLMQNFADALAQKGIVSPEAYRGFFRNE